MKLLPSYSLSAHAPCLSPQLLNLLANVNKLCQGAKGLQATKFHKNRGLCWRGRAKSMPKEQHTHTHPPPSQSVATCPVYCPEARGRAPGVRWKHHLGMPMGEKCRGHRGWQKSPLGRRFSPGSAVQGNLLAFCGSCAHDFRGKPAGLIVFCCWQNNLIMHQGSHLVWPPCASPDNENHSWMPFSSLVISRFHSDVLIWDLGRSCNSCSAMILT